MKINKIKIQEFELFLLLAVFSQVILLISITFADSYIISRADTSNENSKIIDGKNEIKKLTELGLNLLIGFLSIKQIGVVSAQGEELNVNQWCCSEATSGAKCQSIPSLGYESLCLEENVGKGESNRTKQIIFRNT